MSDICQTIVVLALIAVAFTSCDSCKDGREYVRSYVKPCVCEGGAP